MGGWVVYVIDKQSLTTKFRRLRFLIGFSVPSHGYCRAIGQYFYLRIKVLRLLRMELCIGCHDESLRYICTNSHDRTYNYHQWCCRQGSSSRSMGRGRQHNHDSASAAQQKAKPFVCIPPGFQVPGQEVIRWNEPLLVVEWFCGPWQHCSLGWLYFHISVGLCCILLPQRHRHVWTRRENGKLDHACFCTRGITHRPGPFVGWRSSNENHQGLQLCGSTI